jgi:hypothetical protein
LQVVKFRQKSVKFRRAPTSFFLFGKNGHTALRPGRLGCGFRRRIQLGGQKKRRHPYHGHGHGANFHPGSPEQPEDWAHPNRAGEAALIFFEQE